MLIILFLFSLMRTLHGVPIFSPSNTPDACTYTLNSRDHQLHFGERGVNDIIVSCFATIIACTWSTVHPNIPAPTDSWWTRLRRQIRTMVYTLLAPEVMTALALRQHFAAKQIIEDYNTILADCELQESLAQEIILFLSKRSADISDHEEKDDCKFTSAICKLFQDSPPPPAFPKGRGSRWTLAHGFFLQMGGFMLCDTNGKPIYTLTDLHSNEATSIIRAIQNGLIDPPRISEEEIKDRSKGDVISKTVSLLQTSWFIVQCIARWSQHLPVTELEVTTAGFALLTGIAYELWWNKPQNVGRPIFIESKIQLGQDFEDNANCTLARADTSQIGRESWLRRKLRQEIEERTPFMLVWAIPLRFFQEFLRPFKTIIIEIQPNSVRGDLRVGMFHSALIGHSKTVHSIMATSASGTLFGLVHLIPSWFIDFSSHREMWLWRVSAIVITVEPMLTAACLYWDFIRNKSENPVFGISLFIGLPLYIISRFILLSISLISLHSLPPAALETIEWTSFIPHL